MGLTVTLKTPLAKIIPTIFLLPPKITSPASTAGPKIAAAKSFSLSAFIFISNISEDLSTNLSDAIDLSVFSYSDVPPARSPTIEVIFADKAFHFLESIPCGFLSVTPKRFETEKGLFLSLANSLSQVSQSVGTSSIVGYTSGL